VREKKKDNEEGPWGRKGLVGLGILATQQYSTIPIFFLLKKSILPLPKN